MKLTDEEIKDILVSIDPDTKRLPPGFRDFARAIEAAVVERCAQICDAEATVEGIAQKCAAAIRGQT